MDIADVRKELSGDEKVLESVFKIETLYKKYKFFIWGLGIVLLVLFAGKSVMKAMHQSKLEDANQAFLVLQKTSDDTKALAVLKENNPALFELFSYAQATKKQNATTLSSLSKSSNSIISDASTYAVSVLNKKPTDSKLYKEMALLEEAYLALKSGNKKEAQLKLELIEKSSSLSMVAQLLSHATIEVK